LVVLDRRFAATLLRADDLECREALDAQRPAKGLVRVIVAVYGDNLGEALEVLGCLFVGGLEVLAVAAPGGVELDDLWARRLACRMKEQRRNGFDLQRCSCSW
jgi:hypothetical protein